MIDIQLDAHTTEDVTAIQVLRSIGMPDEEIQKLYNKQKEEDNEK